VKRRRRRKRKRERRSRKNPYLVDRLECMNCITVLAKSPYLKNLTIKPTVMVTV